MAIKRVVVESDLKSRPFFHGDTLFTYAERILEEDGLEGEITSVRASVSMVDVSTMLCHRTICGGEVVEIEVRTAAMLW